MKTYIINVSTNEFRQNRMRRIIAENTCLDDSAFIHDGDLDAITPEILAEYFGGELSTLRPAVSCAYKHILAYYALDSSQSEYALILEDDIYLDDGFCDSLKNILDEVKQRKLKSFLISLEESNLKYVKGSERKKNVLLYKKSNGRMAGAYLIDRYAAKAMISEIERNRCNLAIDWFHNYCAENGLLEIYWAHPTISIQGSLNGTIPSLIDNKHTGLAKVAKFKVSKWYKKLLYRMR